MIVFSRCLWGWGIEVEEEVNKVLWGVGGGVGGGKGMEEWVGGEEDFVKDVGLGWRWSAVKEVERVTLWSSFCATAPHSPLEGNKVSNMLLLIWASTVTIVKL